MLYYKLTDIFGHTTLADLQRRTDLTYPDRWYEDIDEVIYLSWYFIHANSFIVSDLAKTFIID